MFLTDSISGNDCVLSAIFSWLMKADGIVWGTRGADVTPTCIWRWRTVIRFKTSPLLPTTWNDATSDKGKETLKVKRQQGTLIQEDSKKFYSILKRRGYFSYLLCGVLLMDVLPPWIAVFSNVTESAEGTALLLPLQSVLKLYTDHLCIKATWKKAAFMFHSNFKAFIMKYGNVYSFSNGRICCLSWFYIMAESNKTRNLKMCYCVVLMCYFILLIVLIENIIE